MENDTNKDHVPFRLLYWALGLGIGVTASLLLAPQSGEETRKLIASRCLDALDAVNEKVRRSSVRVIGAMERRQAQLREAIAESRKMVA